MDRSHHCQTVTSVRTPAWGRTASRRGRPTRPFATWSSRPKRTNFDAKRLSEMAGRAAAATWRGGN